MFKVIDLSTGVSLLDEAGQECLFESGNVAADMAALRSFETGRKWQPRPASRDLNWQHREAGRFADKTYTKLPWYRRDFWKTSSLQLTHYAHVSKLKSGMVAYTESADAGELNKKVTLKPGRYLTRFYPGLSDSEVKECCALMESKHGTPGELLFAETADDIEEVYTLGPESCMSNNYYRHQQGWGDFASSIHPTRVYAAGDLQVAYVRNDKGRVIARSLIWPEKKTHSRIYGNVTKLSELLFQNGYRHRAPFGAKLLKVIEAHPDHGGLGMAVLPYIDRGNSSGGGSCYVQEIPDDDKHLLIVEGPSTHYYEASQLSGLCRKIDYRPFVSSRRSILDPMPDEPEVVCDACGDDAGDNYHEVQRRNGSTRIWCESCTEGDAFFCAGYEQWYSNEFHSPIVTANGDYWSPAYYDHYGFTCDATDEVHHNDDAVHMRDGRNWCVSYFEEHGFFCDATGDAYPIEERVTITTDILRGRTETVAVCPRWAEQNGFGRDGKKLQLSLEIEEHEQEIAF